ncbi:hypothetical protein GDO78_014380 [Eleutherodactylus coqui]|uniref:Uncharacterized protein n=1 Tax=Eleutherodactylus coqui TaxID=57060 RepID=A0A8J6E6U2_ELECQ|nr:hypothetical protein GDO78_014380 [Eleutherodactylus coqui]
MSRIKRLKKNNICATRQRQSPRPIRRSQCNNGAIFLQDLRVVVMANVVQAARAGRQVRAVRRGYKSVLRRLVVRVMLSQGLQTLGGRRRPGDDRGAALLDDNVLVVALRLLGVVVLDDLLRREVAVRARAAVRRLPRAAGVPAVAYHVVALVGWPNRYDQVVAVGDHHIGDLVQALPGNFNAVDLEYFVVDGQQSGALRESSGNEPGDEDARHFLQTVRRHTDAGAVADVEAQGFLHSVFVKPHSAVGFREDIDIDDGGNRPEVAGHPDDEVRLLLVDVRTKNSCQYVLLFGQGVGAKGAVVRFFCGRKKEKKSEYSKKTS